MNKDKKISIIGFITVFIFVVITTFQNCAKVNYQTTETTTSNKSNTTTIARSVTIDPTYNQQKADLKVLFVVDDSYTMSQSQSQLALAIESLLAPLQGQNVEFKIVSTSGVPSNEIDYNISSRYLTEQKVEIPFSQISSLSSYLVEKNISNSSNIRHSNLKLYKDSTPTQINSLKAQIKSGITNVGTNGSETEEGLCAAARQLYDESTSRFFKPGDKVAVILISDEDDSSEFNKCVTRSIQRVSNKSVVYYNYNQLQAQVTLEYQVTRDGIQTWLPTTWGISLSNLQNVTKGTSCSESDKQSAIQKITAQGYQIRNVSNCYYNSITASYYGSDIGDDGSDSTKNLCQSPTYFHGQFFSNLYTMVNSFGLTSENGSCVKQILPGSAISQSIEFDSVFKSDASASNTQNLKYAILNKSTELFGSNGFIFSNIIHIPNESCSLRSGQSYGQKYRDLKTILGANGYETSLCANDFSGILTQTSNFIKTVATKSYVISDLQDNEIIKSVSVRRNNQLIPLTASDVDIIKQTITLTGFNLVQGDTLIVNISN